MKKYRCPTCRKPSCGNDLHTRTKYRGPEKALGDRMKIILTQLNDCLDFDALQPYEMKALVLALIDEHFIETEEY